MISHAFREPPPSYAEATGVTTTTTGTDLSPAYSRHDNSSRAAKKTFPPAFRVYSQSPRHHVLSEGEASGAPLYLVSTNSSLSPKPDIVIHAGLSEDMPPLATVHQEPLSRAASITLPARRGSRFPATTHELLESGGPFTRALSFIIKTPPPSSSSLNAHDAGGGGGGGGACERFEWRHSSGVEVEALGGRHSGWKLVRASSSPLSTNTDTTTSVDVSSSSKVRPQPQRQKQKHHHNTTTITRSGSTTIEVVVAAAARALGVKVSWAITAAAVVVVTGKEVVAVWVGAGSFLARVLRFRFLASGADGSLGERWTVVAVASALAIWNRDRRARSRALGTASF